MRLEIAVAVMVQQQVTLAGSLGSRGAKGRKDAPGAYMPADTCQLLSTGPRQEVYVVGRVCRVLKKGRSPSGIGRCSRLIRGSVISFLRAEEGLPAACWSPKSTTPVFSVLVVMKRVSAAVLFSILDSRCNIASDLIEALSAVITAPRTPGDLCTTLVL